MKLNSECDGFKVVDISQRKYFVKLKLFPSECSMKFKLFLVEIFYAFKTSY